MRGLSRIGVLILLGCAVLPAAARAQFQSCNFCDVFAFVPDPFHVRPCDSGTIIVEGRGFQSQGQNGCSRTPTVMVRSTRPDRVQILSFRVLSDTQIEVTYNVPCTASPGILGIDVTIDDDPSDSIVPYACGNARMSVTGVCGDGFLDPDEECDDGNTRDGDGCRADCTLEACGDGILDPGEECDDGNTRGGDGCRADCTLEACGDGILDPGEECDDGNDVAGDGCRPDCSLEACGDGIRDPGEVCDDGNRRGGDGCRADCSLEECGDGIRDPGEACDDGNDLDGDGCRRDCSVERCGDGVLDGREQCDDGNDLDGDGCSSQCEREVILAVTFESYAASRHAEGVEVRWRTLAEDDALGFVIWRRDGSRTEARLASPVLARGAGSGYGYVDRGASADAEALQYRIQELTSSGLGDSTPWFGLARAKDPSPGSRRRRPAGR